MNIVNILACSWDDVDDDEGFVAINKFPLFTFGDAKIKSRDEVRNYPITLLYS
jgi:hypothetical protein